MDANLLAAIKRELDDGYGIYALTDTEALLVLLPPDVHQSSQDWLLRGGPLGGYLASKLGSADRYSRVWLDGSGRVNVLRTSTRPDAADR